MPASGAWRDNVPDMNIIGIDYGSKLAGTTAIAHWREGEGLRCWRSAKKEDADALIHRVVAGCAPAAVYLDAPLSLPKVYARGGAGDYFYRASDRALRAMSPMFLGGLTARAMHLRAGLSPLPVWEAYPAALAAHWGLKGLGYKEKAIDPAALLPHLLARCPLPGPIECPDWHSFDALLALCTGWRHQQGLHLTFGDADEGLILV